AIMILLGEVVLINTRNQRCVMRSQTTRGSELVLALRTVLKNVLVDVFSAPTTPFLSKTLMRPLTKTRTCVGLTSPMVSGGMNPDSPSVAPRKLPTTGWGERAP